MLLNDYTYILEINISKQDRLRFHTEPLGAAVGQCRASSTPGIILQPLAYGFLRRHQHTHKESLSATETLGCADLPEHRDSQPRNGALPGLGLMLFHRGTAHFLQV